MGSGCYPGLSEVPAQLPLPEALGHEGWREMTPVALRGDSKAHPPPGALGLFLKALWLASPVCILFLKALREPRAQKGWGRKTSES